MYMSQEWLFDILLYIYVNLQFMCYIYVWFVRVSMVYGQELYLVFVVDVGVCY